MNRMIYSACDGKVSDMKALENSSYWEFCSIMNSYLERVDLHNKEVEKMKRENNLGSGKAARPIKSKRK